MSSLQERVAQRISQLGSDEEVLAAILVRRPGAGAREGARAGSIAMGLLGFLIGKVVLQAGGPIIVVVLAAAVAVAGIAMAMWSFRPIHVGNQMRLPTNYVVALTATSLLIFKFSAGIKGLLLEIARTEVALVSRDGDTVEVLLADGANLGWEATKRYVSASAQLAEDLHRGIFGTSRPDA
jgi:hypothetical protein